MAKIEPSVLDALRSAGGKPVGVVISCRQQSAQTAEKLRGKGVSVKDTIAGLDVISADISEDALATLEEDADIEHVELDAEMSIS